MKSIDEVISKIQKLLALSKGTHSEAEAANAAARAAALMDAYKLEAATIEAAGGEVEVDPILTEVIHQHSGQNRVNWKNSIAYSVAKLNGCHMWSSGNSIKAYGRSGDLQTLRYSTQYLWNEIEELTDKEWRKESLRPESTRTWKNSFRLGCSATIYKRVNEIVAAKEAALRHAQDVGDKALMVVAKNALEVYTGYKKLAKDLGLKTYSSSSRIAASAYRSGVAAGAGISLGGSRPQLGAAPGQLKSR